MADPIRSRRTRWELIACLSLFGGIAAYAQGPPPASPAAGSVPNPSVNQPAGLAPNLSANQPSAQPTVERDLACLVSGVAMGAATIIVDRDSTAGHGFDTCPPLSLAVREDLRDSLSSFQPGDRVLVRVLADGVTLSSIRPRIKPTAMWERLVALAVPTTLFILMAVVMRLSGNPMSRLLLGKDGRYSNSKFQVTVWFVALLVVYIAAFALRYVESRGTLVVGPGIPLNLSLLSGLSALSFCGAKVITTARVQREADAIDAGLVGEPPPPPPALGGESMRHDPVRRRNLLRQEAEGRVKPHARHPRFLFDLFRDDAGLADLGDFQMLVVTVLAATMYLVQAFHWLGSLELVKVAVLPDVSSTILTIFGLGQGAYLVKKAVGDGT